MEQGVIAQMSGDLIDGASSPDTRMNEVKMTSPKGKNVTTSISLIETMTEALESKINVTLGNATLSAEKLLGENSDAVAAHLGEENGYLVYYIFALDPDRNFNRILVDPGNGTVIQREQLSKEQLLSQAVEPGYTNLAIPPPADMFMGPGPPASSN
jgi:hypothetical protein